MALALSQALSERWHLVREKQGPTLNMILAWHLNNKAKSAFIGLPKIKIFSEKFSFSFLRVIL